MSLTDILNIVFTLPTIISISTVAVITISFLTFIFKKERKLFKNLRKPIMLISLSENSQNNMDDEYKQLRKVGFFKNIEQPSLSTRNTQTINNHSLIILGIDKEVEVSMFKEVYEQIAAQKKPVIIYTFGDSKVLQAEHWEIINKYLWYSVCNTPLRLNADVFSILSTQTYDF